MLSRWCLGRPVQPAGSRPSSRAQALAAPPPQVGKDPRECLAPLPFPPGPPLWHPVDLGASFSAFPSSSNPVFSPLLLQKRTSNPGVSLQGDSCWTGHLSRPLKGRGWGLACGCGWGCSFLQLGSHTFSSASCTGFSAGLVSSEHGRLAGRGWHARWKAPGFGKACTLLWEGGVPPSPGDAP